jgi:hypothetical protein
VSDADELRWTFEMTAAIVPRLQERLEWALQRQNQRIVRALPTERLPIERRQRLVMIIAGAALTLVLLLLLVDPASRRRPAPLIALAIGFAAAGLAARALPRLRRWSRRYTGAMLGRQAERTFRAVAARAPYTIEYRLAGDRLGAVGTRAFHDLSGAVGVDRALELGAIALVLHAPGVLFAFRRRHAARPHRVIYVSGEREADAVLAAFTAAGAEVEALTSAVEGYVAPIPEARAR